MKRESKESKFGSYISAQKNKTRKLNVSHYLWLLAYDFRVSAGEKDLLKPRSKTNLRKNRVLSVKVWNE